MPGAVEESANVAKSFIGALRHEWPLSLALVLMNICLLVFCWMILSAVSAQREREIALLYADKSKVQDMLAHCVVPERRGDASNRIPGSHLTWPPLQQLQQMRSGDKK